jgi:glycosyltransferase involved in cell wall biosynthesis
MSENKPTLSVVVPAYNVERYIDAAVASTLAQTQPFYEVIVVNDGSTDGTARCLQKYADHPSVRIVHTANQGLGPARNEGLKHASGEFVYFLDSDDILPPRFVAAVSALVRGAASLDMVFFSGEVFFDDDVGFDLRAESSAEEFRRGLEGLYASGIDAVAAMLRTGKFSPSACLYVSRRTLWAGPLGFKPIIHEDDELILRLCARARATRIVDDVLYRRRIRNGSIMSTRTTRRNADGYFAALSATWQLSRQLDFPAHRAVLLEHFRFQAWQYLQACRKAQVMPRVAELLYLARRIRHVPAADLARVLAPSWTRALARRLRQSSGLAAARPAAGAESQS